MVSLYAADITDVAKPVKTKIKVKKSGTQSQETTDVSETNQETTKLTIKEKKPPTEKQLAAIQKAQETRKRKREEKQQLLLQEQAKQQQEKETMDKLEEEKKAKLEAQKQKRKAAREAKKQLTPPPSDTSLNETIDREIEKVCKKPKKSAEEPPAWFKKYIASVKTEESKLSNVKKPKQEIMKEANEQADSQWKNGMVRDRVQNEVDNHMSRMYSMIFGARRL